MEYYANGLLTRDVPTGFTGIDSAYEAPSDPDLTLKAGELTLDDCVQHVVALLKDKVYYRIQCVFEENISDS